MTLHIEFAANDGDARWSMPTMGLTCNQFLEIIEKQALACAAIIDLHHRHTNWLLDEDHRCIAFISKQDSGWIADLIGLLAKAMPHEYFATMMTRCYMVSTTWQEPVTHDASTTLIRNGHMLVLPNIRTTTERFQHEGSE